MYSLEGSAGQADEWRRLIDLLASPADRRDGPAVDAREQGVHSQSTEHGGTSPVRGIAKSGKIPRAWRVRGKITPEMLEHGMPGPNGTRLRIARPGDSNSVGQLLALASLKLPPWVVGAIGSRALSSAVFRALRSGHDELLKDLAEAMLAEDIDRAIPKLGVVLVADDPASGPVGALVAAPPSDIFAKSLSAGVSIGNAVAANAAVLRIAGIGVDPCMRGVGIGTCLIGICLDMYFQLDYQLVYGQFPANSELATYFTGLGFSVLDEASPISLYVPLGLPVGMKPDRGNRFFACQRSAWRANH